jgi:hypothetical protein
MARRDRRAVTAPACGPVVVTGATGFLGEHLCAELAARVPVRALARTRSDYLEDLGVEVVRGDVRSAERSRQGAARRARGVPPGRHGVARSRRRHPDDAAARRRHPRGARAMARHGVRGWCWPRPRAPSRCPRTRSSSTRRAGTRRAGRRLAVLRLEDLPGAAGVRPRRQARPRGDRAQPEPPARARRPPAVVDRRRPEASCAARSRWCRTGGVNFVDARDVAEATANALDRRPARRALPDGWPQLDHRRSSSPAWPGSKVRRPVAALPAR